MKNKKEQFIPYCNYGLGHTTNLVLSFIEMYGNTYASNKHIGERLDISTRTISRSMTKLSDLGIIEIFNPNGRSRFVKLSNLPRQNDSVTLDKESNLPRQNDQDLRQDVSLNLDTLSNNNKENNKLKKKVYNKEDNKPYKKAEEVLEDITDEIFMKPIKTNEIDEVEFQSRINEPNDFMDELLNKKLSSTFD